MQRTRFRKSSREKSWKSLPRMRTSPVRSVRLSPCQRSRSNREIPRGRSQEESRGRALRKTAAGRGRFVPPSERRRGRPVRKNPRGGGKESPGRSPLCDGAGSTRYQGKKVRRKPHLSAPRHLQRPKVWRRRAEAYQKYNKAAMAEMMINVLPDIAGKIAEPLSQIDKITIIGGGSEDNGIGSVAGKCRW